MKTKSIKMTDKERIAELEKQLGERLGTLSPVLDNKSGSQDKSTVTAELNKLSGQLVDLQKAVYVLGDRLNPVTRHEQSTVSSIQPGEDKIPNVLLTNSLINLQQFVNQIQTTVEYLTRNNIL